MKSLVQVVILLYNLDWLHGTISHCTQTYTTEDGKECLYCPPATFLSGECDSSNQSSTCKACDVKHYQQYCNQALSCARCSSNCKWPFTEIIRPCTMYEDIVCQCVKGRYWLKETETDGVCLPHTICPKGYGLVAFGNHLNNTKCAKCVAGHTFATRESFQQCVACKQCKHYRKLCTPVSDAECTTLEESETKDDDQLSWKIILIITVACSVCVIIFVCIACVVCKRRNKDSNQCKRQNNDVEKNEACFPQEGAAALTNSDQEVAAEGPASLKNEPILSGKAGSKDGQIHNSPETSIATKKGNNSTETAECIPNTAQDTPENLQDLHNDHNKNLVSKTCGSQDSTPNALPMDRIIGESERKNETTSYDNKTFRYDSESCSNLYAQETGAGNEEHRKKTRDGLVHDESIGNGSIHLYAMESGEEQPVKEQMEELK